MSPKTLIPAIPIKYQLHSSIQNVETSVRKKTIVSKKTAFKMVVMFGIKPNCTYYPEFVSRQWNVGVHKRM